MMTQAMQILGMPKGGTALWKSEVLLRLLTLSVRW